MEWSPALRNALDPLQAWGYGALPIPCPRDETILSFVDGIRTPAAFAKARAAVDRRAAGVLNAYGERMASLAVRRRDPRVARNGLLAAALAAGPAPDLREVLITLVLLHRACELIGADPAGLFGEVAAIAPASAGAGELLSSIPRRSAEDRSVGAMGFSEASDADGFRFVWNG